VLSTRKYLKDCFCQDITKLAAVYPELAALRGGRTPDMRGMFLRGNGSQAHAQNNGSTVGTTTTTHESGALGQVQGDAMRNITGMLDGHVGYFQKASGAFT